MRRSDGGTTGRTRARARRDDAGGLLRWLAVLALCVAAVALAAQGAWAQDLDEEFDLAGRVVGEGGRPLVGAFVSFAGADWGSLTDEAGRFRLPDVLPGRVELHVEQLGYADGSWAGVVGPGSDALIIRLEPRAVMLEGLRVVTDRFETRRRALAVSSRAYEREDLATSPYSTARDFVEARGGIFTTACRGRFASHATTCVWSRGRAVAPTVYVDEAPVFAGMEYLAVMEPHELNRVEIYGRGTHIRVYTQNFMARAARIRLQPVAFFR